METSSITALCELGMEDSSFTNHQWFMNSLDDTSLLPFAAAFGENIHHSFSHQNFNLKTSMDSVRPTKQLRTDHLSNPQPAFSPHSNISTRAYNQLGQKEPNNMPPCPAFHIKLYSSLLISISFLVPWSLLRDLIVIIPQFVGVLHLIKWGQMPNNRVNPATSSPLKHCSDRCHWDFRVHHLS